MSNKNVKQLRKLESIIGDELFYKVINAMPCASLRLPNTAEFFDKKERNNLIRDEYYGNKTVSREELAIRFGLSLDRVNKILANKPHVKDKTSV